MNEAIPVLRLTDSRSWSDWQWQQRNSIRDLGVLSSYFRNIDPSFFENLRRQNADRIRFQITPYLLSQIPPDTTEADLRDNPWFIQFFPQGPVSTEGHDAYDGTENWESPDEFPTSQLHHKYDNRVVIRFPNCLGYCSFCFEALRTLEQQPKEYKTPRFSDWPRSLDYLRTAPGVEEVILSGGEPLLLGDSLLERILVDISEVKDSDHQPKIRFTRIHTRALTFNPYRVTSEFTAILAKHPVTEIAFNVAHASEITPEFERAVSRLREGAGQPLLVLHTPLLKGVNDSTDDLWELFSHAYSLRIKPYYLLHTLPHIPFADKHRLSVRDGIRLLKPLWRRKSHIALPEYIIVQRDGKQTVPLELGGTPEFRYSTDNNGNPIVHFKNWQNRWVEYPDAVDTIG